MDGRRTEGSTKRQVEIARTTDIPLNEVRTFEVEGLPIAVCNLGGRFYAIDDRCTHDDGPLGEGRLDGPAIECPRHGARFDVRTGELVVSKEIKLRMFQTRIEDGKLFVRLED